MLKKIIGFFKKPQAATVEAVAPYKVEAPIVAEVSPALVQALKPELTLVPTPVKKPRKPAVKKAVAVPLRKADEPKPKKPAAKKPAAPKKAPAKKPVVKK